MPHLIVNPQKLKRSSRTLAISPIGDDAPLDVLETVDNSVQAFGGGQNAASCMDNRVAQDDAV